MRRFPVTRLRLRPRLDRLSDRGQALSEFGLVLPILLLVMFGLIDFGWALQAWLSTENAARHSARYASVGDYDPAYCVDLDGPPSDPCAGTMRAAEIDEARVRSSIPDAALRGGVGLLPDPSAGPTDPHYFHTMICSTRAGFTYTPPNTCSPTDDAGGPGDRVLVVVTYNHPFVTPLIRAFTPMVTFRSSQEMINERFRTSRVIGLAPGVGTVTPTLAATNTPPPTSTPPPTNTPTVTPVPTCDQLTLVRFRIDDDDVEMDVRNNNPNTIYFVQSYINWTDRANMYLDRLRFEGNTYYGGRDFTPPNTRSPSSPIGLAAGARGDWEAQFRLVPDRRPNLDGIFSVTLTFARTSTEPGSCTISGSGTRVAPPPTATRTPTPSPTPCPRGRCPTATPTRTRVPTGTPTRTPTSGPATATPTSSPTRTPTPPGPTTPTPTICPDGC